MTEHKLLAIQDLRVAYDLIEVIHGVSFYVMPGEIVTLIGANCAGKTTLMKAISRLIPVKGGTIEFCGHSVLKQEPQTLVAQGLSHVPEGRGVFLNLTVADNLRLGGYLLTNALYNERKDAVLNWFPRIRERLKQAAGTLSGGELQMLAIARALLVKPKLLLLDEPSLGLAPQLVATIFDIIQTISAAGTAILLVEQNANMALRHAHRAYVLETGNIVLSGPATEVRTSDAVKQAYLGQ